MLKKINHVLRPDEQPFIGMLTKDDIGYKLQRHGLAGLCKFEVRKCYKSDDPFILVEIPRGSVEKVHIHYSIDRMDRALEEFYAA